MASARSAAPDRSRPGRLGAAERFARVLAYDIADAAEPGMSEHDLAHLARERFADEGVTRHWHVPVIGLGAGSAKLRSLRALLSGDLLARRRRLERDDIVYVDIAPVHEGYPSDFTVTRVAGTHPEREQLIADAAPSQHRSWTASPPIATPERCGHGRSRPRPAMDATSWWSRR